jgi:tetratricopeptide (TPR) repeat protein
MLISFSASARPRRERFVVAAFFMAVLLLSAALAKARSQSSGAILEGKVCNAAGDPLAGVSIQLKKDSGEVIASIQTDAAGQYRFSNLQAASYRLTLTRDSFRSLELSVELVKTGGTKHLDAILEKVAIPASNASSAPMDFSDTPAFTVAGVTDWSNVGLHGSDANVHTSDSLAREAASLKSSSPEKVTEASRAGDAHRSRGDAKESSGDPVGAVNEYAAAVKADPSEQNYFAWGAELLLHRAGQLAVQVFSAGSKAHPDSSRMLAGLAVAFYSNGQYNEAATEICRASDLKPNDTAPYLFLGKMEQAAADPFSCSEKTLARFATDQPANAQANFLYGLVLWKNARKSQDSSGMARAERLFQTSAGLHPHFADVYLQLGMLYNAQGKKDAALGAFQKAVAVDPKSSAAHYQLSLAYRRSGSAASADDEMKTYDELRRSEAAALEKERRELRQFVTTLKNEHTSQR